jgi:putative nucleotidyltransferase with HDIG domain
VSVAHLARRFAESLLPIDASPTDDAWARSSLLPGEVALWDRMSRQDRRHSARVARDVDRMLASPPRPVIAAALLHDIGKVASGLGTFGRVVATLVGALRGREVGGRVGQYLQHDRIGAELLATAGSDPLTVAWAAEHHRPRPTWTVDLATADALKLADGD